MNILPQPRGRSGRDRMDLQLPM